MKPHPHFNLLLHQDAELETLLGAQLVERTTLREWPLSCVQRLRLAGGQTWFYKSESGPTVEPEFYAKARSPLLPAVRTLFRDERHACLLIEALPGSMVQDLSLDLAEALQLGDELLRAIAAIGGNPPVYLNVSTWERWYALMGGMLEDLGGLVAARRFQVTRASDLKELARAALSPKIRDAFSRAAGQGNMGLVHHDLNGDNIFLTSSGYRLIDWQRPILGPTAIDLVLLLTSLGFDPRPHLPGEIIAITDLLRAHWFTECTLVWFPPGAETYDRTIAELARNLLQIQG